MLEEAGEQSPVIYHPLHTCVHVFYTILCFYVYLYFSLLPSFFRSRGGAVTRIRKSSQRRGMLTVWCHVPYNQKLFHSAA